MPSCHVPQILNITTSKDISASEVRLSEATIRSEKYGHTTIVSIPMALFSTSLLIQRLCGETLYQMLDATFMCSGTFTCSGMLINMESLTE